MLMETVFLQLTATSLRTNGKVRRFDLCPECRNVAAAVSGVNMFKFLSRD